MRKSARQQAEAFEFLQLVLLFLRLLAARHIAEQREQARAERIELHFIPLAAGFDLQLERARRALRHRRAELVVILVMHARREAVPEEAAEQRFAPAIERAGGEAVEIGDAPLVIEREERIGNAADDAGEIRPGRAGDFGQREIGRVAFAAAEENHDAGECAVSIADGCGAVFDGHGDAFFICQDERAETGGIVDEAGRLHAFTAWQGDAENLVEGAAPCLGERPAGEFLGHRIHKRDRAEDVRADDAVGHAAEGGDEAFLAGAEFGVRAVAADGEFDDRAQFALVEGLEQIAVRLRGARPQGGRFVRVPGQENHRPLEFPLHPRRGFDAVHAPLQADVHEHEVRLLEPHRFHRFRAGAAEGGHFVTALRQSAVEVARYYRLVLHNQDAQRDE